MTWKPDYSVTPRRIVCAACRNKDNHVIIGIRHFDTIMHTTIDSRTHEYPQESWSNCEQGFVDQFGDFISREDAWDIAVKANQIYRLVGDQKSLNEKYKLYSENLY